MHYVLNRKNLPSSAFRDKNVVDWKKMPKLMAKRMPEKATTIRIETSDGYTNWKKNKWGGWTLDCVDGPAKLVTNDGITIEVYVVNGKCHREDGPASIIKKDGEIINFEYCINDKWHREDGPAIMQMREDGTKREAWYLNHKFQKEEIV